MSAIERVSSMLPDGDPGDCSGTVFEPSVIAITPEVTAKMHYRSKEEWRGIPIISIALDRGGFGPASRAVGVIAVGNVALGVVAVGLVAIGPVSLGLVAVGVAAVGLVAGGVVSAGVMAVGISAVGVIATGAHAVGVLAS